MTGARKPWIVKAVGFGAAYLALALVIGLESDWGRRIRPPLPVPKPAQETRADYTIQPEFTLLPLEQGFAETTARPMFIPVRRPPPPPAPPKPAMQKGQFVLLGALITKDKSIALLREVATGKAIRVEQGKEIKGITVANVYPEKVALTQYDDTEELVLKIQPLTKLPAVPMPSPVAPKTAAPVQAGQPQPAPPQPAASSMPPAELGRAQINERRATHGIPPI